MQMSFKRVEGGRAMKNNGGENQSNKESLRHEEDREHQNEFEKLLPENWSKRDRQLTMLAYRLAKYGHRDQERDNGERYFNHPKQVAVIALTEMPIYSPDTEIRPEMIIKALLHDIKEDSFILTYDDIELIFGNDVCDGIAVMTKNKKLPKIERDELYFHGLQGATNENKIVKLLDRLHNLRDMWHCDIVKQRKNIKETEEHYLPLAQETNQYLYEQIKQECAKLKHGLY